MATGDSHLMDALKYFNYTMPKRKGTEYVGMWLDEGADVRPTKRNSLQSAIDDEVQRIRGGL